MQFAQKLTVRWLALAAIALFVLTNSCNKSSDFGAGLIEQDDFLTVKFDQVVNLEGETFIFDSVPTYDRISRIGDSTLVFGSFTDPIFGKVEAQIYTLMRQESISPVVRTEPGLVCDSMKLCIRVARNLFYGDTLQPFNIGVYRLSEEFPKDSIIYSNKTVPYDPVRIGYGENIVVKPNSLIEFPDSTQASFFIEINMDIALGQEILDNPSVLDTIINFQDFLRGFLIKAESDSPLFGFNLLSGLTRLKMYYSNQDTSGIATFSVREATSRFANYQFDYSNTFVEEYLDNGQPSSDLLFLQGLSGVRSSLTLPELEQFNGKSIKLALLEIPIADIPDNAGGLYPPISQLLLSYKNMDGNLRLLDELIIGGALSLSAFGGSIQQANINGKQVSIYRMNISRYVQDYLNGNRPSTLFLSAVNSFRAPERVVMNGTNHPDTPVMLKIVYTDF